MEVIPPTLTHINVLKYGITQIILTHIMMVQHHNKEAGNHFGNPYGTESKKYSGHV